MRERGRERERGGRKKYKVYRRGTCTERGLIFGSSSLGYNA